MTPYETIIKQQFDRGMADARDLRSRSAGMDGTGIIAAERIVPIFEPDKDYSDWPVGAPVREQVDGEYQVFKLLQPYNAAHYPGSTPSNTPAIWSICHTKDPARAKPYMAPNGTSGMYMKGECCTDPKMPDPSAVYRSLMDKGAYAPSEYIQNWEEVILEEEVI